MMIHSSDLSTIDFLSWLSTPPPNDDELDDNIVFYSTFDFIYSTHFSLAFKVVSSAFSSSRSKKLPPHRDQLVMILKFAHHIGTEIECWRMKFFVFHHDKSYAFSTCDVECTQNWIRFTETSTAGPCASSSSSSSENSSPVLLSVTQTNMLATIVTSILHFHHPSIPSKDYNAIIASTCSSLSLFYTFLNKQQQQQ